MGIPMVKVVVYCIIFGVGLLQLPLLVDIVANLLPQYDIKRWSNRVVGGILMSTCSAVALGGYWVWYASVLPLWLYPTPVWSSAGAAHLVFGTWLWLLTMTNYIAAATTPPGLVVPVTHLATTVNDDKETSPRKVHPQQTDTELLESMRRPFYCRHCKLHRPAATFHCHDCHSCGAEVDHHCPFVNVCVGRDNYRYFARFLFYGFLGMLYTAIITFPPFYSCWVESFALGEAANGRKSYDAACSAHPEYTLVFLAPLGLGVAIGNLLACQVVLLLGDIRTVDSLRYLRQTWNLAPLFGRVIQGRGFDQGSTMRSLIFSPRTLWWHFVVPGKWSPKVQKTD
jgi:hypothetical protein|eukprot:m.104103 g.104103  ORF g.104103 m.104103 type:complete len:340 (+) comp20914_c0_seq1:218-1237(+)